MLGVQACAGNEAATDGTRGGRAARCVRPGLGSFPHWAREFDDPAACGAVALVSNDEAVAAAGRWVVVRVYVRREGTFEVELLDFAIELLLRVADREAVLE